MRKEKSANKKCKKKWNKIHNSKVNLFKNNQKYLWNSFISNKDSSNTKT